MPGTRAKQIMGQVIWFVGLWAAGVLCVTLVGVMIKAVL